MAAAVFGLGAAVAPALPAMSGHSAPSAVRSFAGAANVADSERAAPAGIIDGGAEILPQAGITLDQTLATARGAASGPIGEVDLECYRGTLVFNVDVGSSDVKVDAATGLILGNQTDDPSTPTEPARTEPGIPRVRPRGSP